MKNCFKKHFAYYALAILGFGLNAPSHATDTQVTQGAANITPSIAIDTNTDTPALDSRRYPSWHWYPGYFTTPPASVTVNGVTVFASPNASYQAVTAVRDQLYTNLQSGLDTAVRAELSKVRDFKWSTASIAGPIDLGIQPNGTGGSTFSMGGFSALISFNFSGNLDDWFHTSWECNVGVNTGPLYMTGNLDLVTGNTYNTALSLNNPNVSASCSTGFGIIPGVSFVTDYIVNRAINNINNSLQQLNVPLQLGSFMGLNAALPANSFPFQSNSVCPQGCFMGDQIRNGLIPLVQSANVAVHFNPKASRLFAPSPYIPPVGEDEETGRSYIQNDEAVSISLSGGSIKLTVYDSIVFTSWYGCTGSGTCEY